MKRFARIAAIVLAILAAAPDAPIVHAAPASTADENPSVRRGPRRPGRPRRGPGRRRTGPLRRVLGRILGR